MTPVEIRHSQIGHIYQYPSEEITAQAAASYAKNLIAPVKHPVVTFATGNTMIPVLDYFVKLSRRERTNLHQIIGLHLDEYYPQDPQGVHSFVKFLYERAFQPLGLASENIHTLNGLAQNPHKESARYEALIRKLKVDLAFLGIGPGGHMGFNEANTPFSSTTHLAQLSEETVRRDKERGQNTSDTALTQGISTILRAQHHILVAFGHEKGDILREALFGEISPKVPASALRKVGKKVVMFVDESAGHAITR